jgi:hypothetical protein
MKNANNDNDTWISIGLAAALVLNKFRLASQITEITKASGEINGTSLLGTRISTEVDTTTLNGDAGLEATRSIDVVADATNVTSVQCPIGLTKVLKSVIISDAVYMVDHLNWPSTVNPEPSKPVSLVVNSINANDDIAVRGLGSGDGSRLGPVIHRDQPDEQACFRVIPEQVPEPLDHQIGMEVVNHANPSKDPIDSIQTNGLGDAGPVDEVSKDDEERGGRNTERCKERESEHPRRASA